MRLFRAGDVTPISATLDNISGGGLFFTSPALLLPGEHLTCQVTLPLKTCPSGESALLECHLVAIRTQAGSSEYGVGCQFNSYRVRMPRDEAAHWQTASTVLSRNSSAL
jgi:hypothetical protein